MSLPPRHQLPPPVIRTEPPFAPNSRPRHGFDFLYSPRGPADDEPEWDGWPRYWPRALAAALVLNVALVALWWWRFDSSLPAPPPGAAASATAAASAPAAVPSSVLFFQPVTVNRP